MNRFVSYLKARTGQETDADGGDDERRSPDAYECPACGALIMQPSTEECSQCQSATLVPRDR